MCNIKLLIVDDDPHIINILLHYFEEKDFSVVTASDGESGLIKAIKDPPDVILLDVEMPKMRGWQVCQLLKNNKRTAEIPIIIMTSKSEMSDIIVAMQQGADDYMMKPFSEEQLLHRIERILNTR